MRYVKIAICLFVLVPALIFGLEAYYLKAGDSIHRANIETKWLLRAHRFTDRSDELKKWLTQYHGEASGSEVMALMASWCINNKSKAEELFSGFNQAESALLAKRLSSAAHQSGTANQFQLTFKESNVPLLSAASNELKNRVTVN